MTRPIETTSPEKRQALQAILQALPGTSCAQQRGRIIAALQIGPLTSFEAMRYLDSFDPRPRILELRDQGHDIVLHWVRIATEAGAVHRVGQYVLKFGGGV
jgi:hypothetical protein